MDRHPSLCTIHTRRLLSRYRCSVAEMAMAPTVEIATVGPASELARFPLLSSYATSSLRSATATSAPLRCAPASRCVISAYRCMPAELHPRPPGARAGARRAAAHVRICGNLVDYGSGVENQMDKQAAAPRGIANDSIFAVKHAPTGLTRPLMAEGEQIPKWWQGRAIVFALAGISNMCGAAITNPVNVIKVRMQLDGALASTAQGKRYRKMFPGILQIAKDEGLSGLWRGTAAALLREASYSSIRMGAYEPLKMLFGGENPSQTPLWVKLAAGASAGIVGSAVANPTDVVMIRMQAGSGAQQWQYKGPMHAFSSIARTEGIRGLYRGVWPTMQRAGLLTAAQVSSYDHTKHILLNSGWVKEGVLCHFSSSMIAGLVTAIVISPVDLIKTRIMQQAVTPDGNGAIYGSTLECFWKTLKSEGPHGLYKGFVPVWMRIGPHTIITFFVFEQLRKALGIAPV